MSHQPRHYGFGDELTNLYVQAAQYAKQKEQQSAISSQHRTLLIGGAALAGVTLVGLLFIKLAKG